MTRLLPELVLDRARQHAAAPAVLSDTGDLTYRELELSASRIADALAGRGIGPGSPVGVLVTPGAEMVTALLGIWLAGGCYVPLDPLAPVSRLRAVVELAGADVVLVDDHAAVPELATVSTVCAVARLSGRGGWKRRPQRVTHPRQAAYMIFTSGSTGTPKGVVVEHEGIANRVMWGVR